MSVPMANMSDASTRVPMILTRTSSSCRRIQLGIQGTRPCLNHRTSLLDDDGLVFGLVAGDVRIKDHVVGYAVLANKARQRPDVAEEAHLVHLQSPALKQ